MYFFLIFQPITGDDSDSTDEMDKPGKRNIGRATFEKDNHATFDTASSDNNWMSAAQFSTILDKQEELENTLTSDFEAEQQQPRRSKRQTAPVVAKASRSSSSNYNKLIMPASFGGRGVATPADAAHATSYLDQDAKIPFKKLKQVSHSLF